MGRRLSSLLFGMVGLGLIFIPLPAPDPGPPTSHLVVVEADDFTYSPSSVRVQRGDIVTLRFEPQDVVHGLVIDGYDVDLTAEPGQPEEVTFMADRPGAFQIRCSVACGTLHPFMTGEFHVGSNLLLWRALSLTLLAAVGAYRDVATRRAGGFRLSIVPRNEVERFDLTAIPWIATILKSRWLQWSLMAITLVFFMVAILSGLFGTPVGNRNFGIIFTWIVWWALLILVMIPFAGRLWCGMCPIPAPGEWLQRRALVAPPNKERTPFTLGRKWPRKLRNIWLQNGSFLLLALFSVPILTRPRLTGIVLVLFIVVAIGISLVYERRTFCRYLCPVGGFIGLYSTIAPLELRVKNHDVCASHSVKECYIGNERGYGCPWLVFPGNLAENTFCGMCTECLKTCSLDNVAVQLRPFGQDLIERKASRLDEAVKAVIMLTCAFVYSVVLLGPDGAFKNAANDVGSLRWLAYATVFLATNLLIVPSLFYGVAWLGRRFGMLHTISARQLALEFASALIPLGLAAWMAFSLSFVFVNGSYALPALSDPFGWGWDLLGLTDVLWRPVLPSLIPILQIPILIGGLLAAINLLVRATRRHVSELAVIRVAAPAVVFCTLATMAFMVVFLA